MKIISGKSIHLSDITKSNDSMEISWITKFIEPIFIEEFNKGVSATQYFKSGYPQEDFAELIKQYTDIFFKEDQRLYSYLVCCFSEEGDLLSQWRGYADDAKGLAIGFDSGVLSSASKRIKDDSISSDVINIDKVVYDEYTQKNRIRRCAQELIAELKPLAKDSVDDIKQKSKAAFEKKFLQLFKCLY